MNLNLFRFWCGHHDTTHAQIAALQQSVEREQARAAARHTEVKGLFMTLSARAQQIVDEIRASRSIAESSAAALTTLVAASASLSQKITELQAKVDAGTSSSEDLDAIAAASTELHDTAVKLQEAVPQNTEAPKPASGGTEASGLDQG